MRYIKDTIDIKNITSILKAISFGYKDVGNYMIKGGNISEADLAEMASKQIDDLRNETPFKIDDAFEMYKKDPFLTYFEIALKRALYAKYLKLFDESGISIAGMMVFMIRAEVERDELRLAWLSRYYGVSAERIENIKILKKIR